LAHQLAGGIVDVDHERHVTGQGMRGAAEAGIVGAKRHLDLVEQAFADFALLDQALGGRSTLMAIRAALLPVATIMFAIVIRPRSSVL
jgi:hypothetical protein